MRKYSKEISDFIESHVKGISCEELVKITNENTGAHFTISKMRGFLKNHGLKSGVRGNGAEKRKIFIPEIEKFIKENAVLLPNKDLAELVNKTFSTKLTTEQVKNFKHRKHISSGLTGHFKKGHIPQNKGKKMSAEIYKKVASTMFKKGHTPHNHRPIGSERTGKDGYLQVKIAEPKKWVGKQIAVWEAHNGKVPKGHTVIFLDKNIRNFDISNLACVSREELLRLNQNHRLSEFPEVSKAGIALEKYKNEIRKKRI